MPDKELLCDWSPLEGPPPDIMPTTWDSAHVGKRIVQGFETLIRLPGSVTRLGSYSCWPTYAYEFDDLVAQQQQEASEKARAQQAQNRARVSPSIEQITFMERSLYWPPHYLAREPWLMRAVNGFAFARSLDRDIRWLVRRRGGRADTWRARYSDGCARIAHGLIADRAMVF